MAGLSDLDRAAEFFRRYFRFGGTKHTLSKLLGNDKLMKEWIQSLNKQFDVNPFEQTIKKQLTALRKQNELGDWGISEETFDYLTETAPTWPEGKDAYRSFRIRFGEGRDGVVQTFEAHAKAIKRVHDEYWRWEQLLSGAHPYQDKDVERLRLLNGNYTHNAVVEWIIIPDLSAHRRRDSITAVRSEKSLADEGLVLMWLVPNRGQAIDYDEWCSLFLGGYELNVPEEDDESWQNVVLIDRFENDNATSLYGSLRSNGDSGSSVPTFE